MISCMLCSYDRGEQPHLAGLMGLEFDEKINKVE